MTARWHTVPHWFGVISPVRFTHLRSALSLLGLLLTLVAVVAGGLGAWRFGADAGWTNTFFVADGFLSHWQVWGAFAIGVQACACTLNRGVAATRSCIACQEAADRVWKQPGEKRLVNAA
jgi:hypothetical protein